MKTLICNIQTKVTVKYGHKSWTICPFIMHMDAFYSWSCPSEWVLFQPCNTNIQVVARQWKHGICTVACPPLQAFATLLYVKRSTWR